MRERRLATELRRLREASALTLEEAAQRLGWSKTKLSRIENVLRRVDVPEVEGLLELYGVAGQRHEALIKFTRTAGQRDWWDAEPLRTDYVTYIGLEAEAEALSCYSMGVIHGLLQTEDYAHQVIQAALMRIKPPSAVGRRVAVRATRQAVLTERDEPLRFWSIIDEAVLNREIGGKEVMRAQYERLLELAELPNVTLQVMPAAAGAHPGVIGSFSILHFPEQYFPDVVYVESMTGALYIEDESQVHTHTLAFEQMQSTALNPGESAKLIGRRAGR
ncbi:helix-turn-helix transcriptional regulator [Actinomadura sp. DC4]|uniref:helix-turn-helix domain-containing protein n=1 Tax=Actinomadura sp. DC4 TaxID=3055069 RepID=UPI0025AFB506|nr:helix-turn-helix transcriptional regulator [Actinomadura sp. DC4]MDN3359291.1 helix-turn-helix transcriptional regulator [Actinomadura sp. DC4]